MSGIGDHLGELLWTKILAPIFERLGRWEILFVCLLWLAGTAEWFYRDQLTSGEFLLWGSLLALIPVSWFGVCRPLWRSRVSRTMSSLIFRGALLLILGGSWVWAAYSMYRIPTLANGEAGLYIARFEGDRRDEVQEFIYNKIRDYVGSHVDSTDRERIRIVRLLRRFNPDEEINVRKFSMGGSSSVLAGRIDAGNTLRARLVNVHMEGVLTAPISGFQLSQSQISLPGEINTLCDVVPLFLVGYRLYQAKDFERANTYFGVAIKSLERASSDNQGQTSARLMLASLYFFRGNGFYLQEHSDKTKALADYQRALERSSEGITHSASFLAPRNNLAFLLLKQGEPSKAADAFEEIHKACDTGNDFSDRITCAYAAYNLAGLQLDQHSYKHARDLLEEALQRFSSIAEETPVSDLDFEFAAYVHNNIAYSYMQDAEDKPGRAAEYYRKADREMVTAERVLARSNQNIPPAFQRNKARVYIYSRQWGEALRALEVARHSEPENPDGCLLRAIVLSCSGDTSHVGDELKSFVAHQPNMNESKAGMDYFKRKVEQCSLTN
jgi:tetratricopeptide (TPR) repeat protein